MSALQREHALLRALQPLADIEIPQDAKDDYAYPVMLPNETVYITAGQVRAARQAIEEAKK